MSTKKYTSILLGICMLLQLVCGAGMVASAEPASNGINYIINDEFGSATDSDNGLNGWELKMADGYSSDNPTLTTEAVGQDNYALKFSLSNLTAWINTYINRTLPEPVEFESGKDVVIETKVKLEGAGSRYFFKMNLDGKVVYGDTSFTTTEEWNYDRGTLFRNDGGQIDVPNAWYDTSMSGDRVTNDGMDAWYGVKITINGDTKTASYVFTDENGAVVTKENKSIDYPDSANWVEDALNTLNFRLRGSTSTDLAINLFVDYVRVYETSPLDMQVNGSYLASGDVTVNFSKADASFKDAVAIYDAAGNKVDAVNTIDATNKIVTINPDENLTAGATYTVKLNANLIPANYLVSATEKTFVALDKAYIIYDEFGASNSSGNGLNGWELKMFPGMAMGDAALTTEEVAAGTGNYMLKYSLSYTSAWWYTYLNRALPEQVTFENGKDVVIETKVKMTGDNGARSFFKMNLDGNNYSMDEWNYDRGTLFRNDGGLIDVPGTWYDTSMSGDRVATNGMNTWYDVKITIHGDTKTASYVFTDESGNVITKANKSIDYPDSANWVEDVLKTLNFRLRGSMDANLSVNLYVDYVKVYEGYALDMQVDESYIGSKDVTVTFDTALGDASLKDAVAIYDAAGNKVDAVNTIDATNKIVTINPDENLTEGATYTVKLNTSMLQSNYIVGATEKTFVALDKDYIIYDEFGASSGSGNGLDGWELKVLPGGYNGDATLTTEPDGQDNYLLKYSLNYTSSWMYTYINKALPEQATFEDGKDVVIETKVKMTGDSGARSFLKMNLDGQNYSQDEWNYDRGTLFRNDGGQIDVPIQWYDDFMKGDRVADNGMNTWYDVKITIHGDTKTASYVFTDESGTKIAKAYKPINYPDSANWVEDVLNTLNFRLRGEMSANCAVNLYVDYVKVYEEPVVLELSLIDANGNAVEGTLPAGAGTYKTKINYNGSENTFCIITALYKGQELKGLLKTDYVDVASVNESVNEFTLESGAGYTIKAFCWSSLDNLVPLVDSVVVGN